MMRHPGIKAVALVLAMVSAVGAILGGLVVFLNVNYNCYSMTQEEYLAQRLENHGASYANCMALRYAWAESEAPWDVLERMFGESFYADLPYVDYVIYQDGKAVQEVRNYAESGYVYSTTLSLSVWGGNGVQIGADDTVFWEYEEYVPEDWPVEVKPPREVEPTQAGEEGVPTEASTIADLPSSGVIPCWTSDGDIYGIYQYEEPISLEVELFYTQEQLDQVHQWGNRASAMGTWIYAKRYDGIWVLALSVAIYLGVLVYLTFVAGRKRNTQVVSPGGVNRLPLDVYAGVDLLLGMAAIWSLAMVVEQMFQLELLDEAVWDLLAAGAVGLCAVMGLMVAGAWMALCAQVKAGHGFWWKNTLTGRILIWGWKNVKRGGRWLRERTLDRMSESVVEAFWYVVLLAVAGVLGLEFIGANPIWIGYMILVGGFATGVFYGTKLVNLVKEVLSRIPLMWQWLLLSGVGMLLLMVIGAFCHSGLGILCYLALCVCLLVAVAWCANAFGKLREGAQKMSQGSLDEKIDPQSLRGCFRDFAEDLNALSDGCILAAQEQMKSERMKTELITNVSHDIKTPLTSIINYVDLLQQAQTPAQREEYLEVLSRQSLQLKKLIEDLMEMSKASSGNVTVDLSSTDVVECVVQTLGEYGDRFDRLGLHVVARGMEESRMALCDGRLLWRVLSNVMSNIVKYALPGTRVYLDLSQQDNQVNLSLKNISREELNITAEELMERFVRGDRSRNTEGNGLGLNIAKSLMEVQGGSLDLMVDGDLFKVILTLPQG